VHATLQAEEIRSQLQKLGFEPMTSTPGAMGEHLSREVAKWAKVIKASGARSQDAQ
jgi:hypothetical protein